MNSDGKKPSQVHVEITQLPNHLILEHILPRLPVRSLFRFKSVCKDWCFTISRRNFTKSHVKLSSFRPQQFLLHAKESGNSVFHIITYDACIKTYVKGHEVVPFNDFDHLNGTIVIVGSSNGLVCLYYEHNQRRWFYLWNPATSQCREIDQISELEEVDPFMFTAAYGFGYASSIDDYKIAAIFSSYSDGFTSRFYVFSLRSGKWERFECGLDGYRVSTTGIYKGVLVDDTLYWPLRFRNHGEERKQIVGFDLVHERLEVKPWMSWLPQRSEIDLPLFCIEDCLALCRYTDYYRFDFWMLKQRDDWSSWEKLFFVDIVYVDFVHFCKTGRCCLVHHLNRLKVIDQISPKAIECTERDGDGVYDGQVWEVDDYAESFVSPFSNTEFDQHEKRHGN